jgi:hypothetical protein
VIRLAPCAALVLTLAACGAGDRGGMSTVTDSAGIRLVTSVVPAWSEGKGWRLDTTPLLDIGAAAEDEGDFLQDVSGVRLLADGRIAVANGVEQSIVYFDDQGVRAGRLGGNGEGPGEFRGVTIVGLLGDSVLAWDPQLDRVTVVTPEGTAGRMFRLVEQDTASLSRFGFVPVDIYPDGSLLLAGRVGASNTEQGGVRRDPVPMRRAPATGTTGTPLVVVPGSENIVVTGKGFVTMFERPFGLRTTTVASGTDLLVSTGEFDGVMVFDSTGTLKAVWRIDRPRRAVSDRDIEEVTAMRVAQLNQMPKPFADAIHEVTKGVGYPGVLPSFDAMLRDATGAIWLRHDVGPVLRDSIPREWSVLDATGRWLGVVTMPRRLQVQQITADRVVAVWKDADEVEHVRLYRLRR